LTDEPVLFEDLEDEQEFLSGDKGHRFRKDKTAPLLGGYSFVNAVWVEPNEGKVCFFKKDSQCYPVDREDE
jgi:hypothetical protein